MQGDVSNIKVKTEMNDDTFELYYTAAFEDKGITYYSERGGGIQNPNTRVYWYSSEEAAMLAVTRVVAAKQKMTRDHTALREESSHQESTAVHEEKPSIIDATKPAVNDDSSLSNMSIDESSSSTSPAPHAAMDLPALEVKDWMKGKSVRCKYFNTKTGCDRGSSCKYGHVQKPIGQKGLSYADPIKVGLVSERFILQKEGLTSSFDLFYTAAYFNPSENVIYYAEGGNSVGQSSQGIWWYADEDDAVSAVKRVVAVSHPNGSSAGTPKRVSASRCAMFASPDAMMRRLERTPSLNLQTVIQKIFPGALLRKDECWRVRHGDDGLVTVSFRPPKETATGAMVSMPLVHPTWRGGTVKENRWWYKEERTAKNAAFMRFLELCAEHGVLKDARHTLDGRALF